MVNLFWQCPWVQRVSLHFLLAATEIAPRAETHSVVLAAGRHAIPDSPRPGWVPRSFKAPVLQRSGLLFVGVETVESPGDVGAAQVLSEVIRIESCRYWTRSRVLGRCENHCGGTRRLTRLIRLM